jgi:hypothetical protein
MTYSNDSYRSQPPPTFTPAVQAEQHRQPARHSHRAQVPAPTQEQPPSRQEQSYRRAARKTGLTAAEKFWYVLGCLYFGAAYFAKIPAKKAMEDFGLAELTSAESFWYILMCIWFGAGYLAKVPTAKALSELAQFRDAGHLPLEYTRAAR